MGLDEKLSLRDMTYDMGSFCPEAGESNAVGNQRAEVIALRSFSLLQVRLSHLPFASRVARLTMHYPPNYFATFWQQAASLAGSPVKYASITLHNHQEATCFS